MHGEAGGARCVRWSLAAALTADGWGVAGSPGVGHRAVRGVAPALLLRLCALLLRRLVHRCPVSWPPPPHTHRHALAAYHARMGRRREASDAKTVCLAVRCKTECGGRTSSSLGKGGPGKT